MGECKTRHAGDRSVIQHRVQMIGHYLSSAAFCFSGLLCSLSLGFGSSSLL